MRHDYPYIDPLRPPTLAYAVSENRRLARKLRTARFGCAALTVLLLLCVIRLAS